MDVIRLDREASSPVAPKTEGDGPSSSIFSLQYWMPLFDVSDVELGSRLKTIFTPNFLRGNAARSEGYDLYLPFWTASTLILCLLILGHLNDPGQALTYNFDIVPAAASYIYGYLFFSSLIIYIYAKINNAAGHFTKIVSLVGQSLVFYLPVALLAVIPSLIFHLFLFIAAFGFSVLFLLTHLRALHY